MPRTLPEIGVSLPKGTKLSDVHAQVLYSIITLNHISFVSFDLGWLIYLILANSFMPSLFMSQSDIRIDESEIVISEFR